ncbi:GNAT family N-acetyltransferase [Ferrimonas sediminicola]|uniref:GNAT family N-acetyltransferase n=1 Tax=Ferrimonas sediminicola TaxID=2569538 RepID=A0A4U1BHE8_9GAMM|nr:GNAT family N-acetyltransferase [Ferrimonas sediminicola]
MQLRVARWEDIPAIQLVRNAVRENRLSVAGSIKEADVASYLEARGRGWVCEAGDRIVGFTFADAIDASIWALFLLPEWEGQGLGRRLLETACNWLFAQGVKEIRLSTARHTRAHGFYLKLGWRETGARGNGEAKLRLRRPRAPAAPPAS